MVRDRQLRAAEKREEKAYKERKKVPCGIVSPSTFVKPLSNRFKSEQIPSEILDYSLEGLMLKLKLQYFGHLMQRSNLIKKTLMLGTIEGSRRRGRQRTR